MYTLITSYSQTYPNHIIYTLKQLIYTLITSHSQTTHTTCTHTYPYTLIQSLQTIHEYIQLNHHLTYITLSNNSYTHPFHPHTIIMYPNHLAKYLNHITLNHTYTLMIHNTYPNHITLIIPQSQLIHIRSLKYHCVQGSPTTT